MATHVDNEVLERFETIWEYVECGISIIDAETREILDINPVAARMFGDSKEKIIGKRCHKFICPAEECSCPIMDRNQTVDRSERVFVRANGEILPIIKSVAKIRFNGRLALLESFTDISNLKEAEEKVRLLRVTEQANKAKSDFLSRMSHEMRTPMNAIIGMTKIAENTDDVAKLKYCLATIGVSSNHLLGIINDILDMSKIEAGKLELDSAPLNLETLLMKICNLTTEQAGHKGIALTLSLNPAMPMAYTGDEQRLSQVLMNLMSNALKFTPKGGIIHLAVQEAERRHRSSLLRFVLSDTGIGMTKEQISRLFNAFEQADTSISRRFGGTGLGLAISASIVEHMGGSILVDSEPGRGSVFTVEVELPRREEPGAALRTFGARSASDIRVLLLCNDENTRKAFLAIARHAGLQAAPAWNVEHAVRLLRPNQDGPLPFDAIFLDEETAGEDMVGAQTLAAAGAVTLILITTFVRWNILDQAARKAGVTHFVATPLFPSALLSTLETSLGYSPRYKTPVAHSAPDFSNLHILLVEDVAINREIFLALLEETGIHIDTAENGQEAVTMFKNAPDRYAMIIMDLQMPIMDGYEATTLIRTMENQPRARTIPIIAMTANAFKEDIDKCLACGMNDHLSKPIDEAAVKEKIARFKEEAPPAA